MNEVTIPFELIEGQFYEVELEYPDGTWDHGVVRWAGATYLDELRGVRNPVFVDEGSFLRPGPVAIILHQPEDQHLVFCPAVEALSSCQITRDGSRQTSPT